jgi:hypothetical protein
MIGYREATTGHFNVEFQWPWRGIPGILIRTICFMSFTPHHTNE